MNVIQLETSGRKTSFRVTVLEVEETDCCHETRGSNVILDHQPSTSRSHNVLELFNKSQELHRGKHGPRALNLELLFNIIPIFILCHETPPPHPQCETH